MMPLRVQKHKRHGNATQTSSMLKPMTITIFLMLGILLGLMFGTGTQNHTPVAPDTPVPLIPQHNTTQLEALLLDTINQQREKNGYGALHRDRQLDALAESHNLDMRHRKYHGHNTPEGLTASDRARLAGYSCTVGALANDKVVGEIILSAELWFEVSHSPSSDWLTEEQLSESLAGRLTDSGGGRQRDVQILLNPSHKGIGMNATIDPDRRAASVVMNFC